MIDCDLPMFFGGSMRGLFLAALMLVTTPACAQVEYQAADGNTYYRITFALASGIEFTAGISGRAGGLEYSSITPPQKTDEQHYTFTASIDQTALSIRSHDRIIKAEYQPAGSVYISGDGPILFLSSIQTREDWKPLVVTNDGRTISLEGLDAVSNVTLPALTTEHIVTAAKKGVARDFVNDNSEFWLNLAKECHIENAELTGACRLYVHKATVKLTFEHEAPLLLTIDYLIGC